MTPERFAKLKSALARRQPDLTVLLDSVNKPRNVSAIVRSADAVGIVRIHSLSTTGAMRRHHDIAGGARHWVGVQLHRSSEAAVAALHADGWRIVVAEASAGALDYREIDYTGRVALALGAELRGVSQAVLDAADERVAIPMHGLVTSVNVSVAAGVILFEAERQRTAAGLYDTCRLTCEEYDRTLFEWAYPEVAARCRELQRPYPTLRPDGLMASNPLLDVP